MRPNLIISLFCLLFLLSCDCDPHQKEAEQQQEDGSNSEVKTNEESEVSERGVDPFLFPVSQEESEEKGGGGFEIQSYDVSQVRESGVDLSRGFKPLFEKNGIEMKFSEGEMIYDSAPTSMIIIKGYPDTHAKIEKLFAEIIRNSSEVDENTR